MTQPALDAPLRHRDILAIALPMIASNVSTPLLGLVDTAVIGNQGRADYLGAVAVGAGILTFVYWSFAFLQMGTSGLTAQADGAGDRRGVEGTLVRGLAIALGAGLCLILLQTPLIHLGLGLMAPPPSERTLAESYLSIRLWSAPFALSNLVLLGWFVGQRRARTALALQIALNGLNLALNLVFVLGLNWGVAGIATGTLVAEISAAGFGLGLAWRRLGAGLPALRGRLRGHLADGAAMTRLLTLGRDIFLRTLCMLIGFTFFVAQGARAGSVPLAANAVLMQMVSFSAFFLDGFASASEALSGQAFGARRPDRIKAVMARALIWALATALALSLVFAVLGPVFIRLLTNAAAVRAMAETHLVWLILMPVFGVWSFLLDGLFFGATRGPQMRNAAVLALLTFFAAWAVLMPRFGIAGLWAALMVYYVARAGFLAVQVPRLLADAQNPAP